jgi:drug/metabolite transporter (DMT)-like permease
VPEPAGVAAMRAKLLLLLLCLIWGVTWPVVKIALNEIPPFTMRTCSVGLGAATLFMVCLVKGRSFRIPTTRACIHVTVASLLNIAAFTVLSAFAQLATTTSRVSVLAYTMPIWAVVLAWPFLGERPTRMQTVALGLSVVGLAILIYPLTAAGVPLGVLLALTTGLLWAAGTVYLKWAHIDADPMGVSFWQLMIAFVVIAACTVPFQGGFNLGNAHAEALLATVFAGVVGNGVAYGLWFEIVRRLPAATASLGLLSVPVIGIVASTIILGEVPTAADIIGFALIFAASACVLVARPAPVAVTT